MTLLCVQRRPLSPCLILTLPRGCVSPPDTVVKGSATVMICGMPAARMGDTTAHGGNIVPGCPTVMIGG